jgi:hypothetical protein
MKPYWVGSGIVVILAAVFFAESMFLKEKPQDNTPVPPAAEARALVVEKYGDCTPERCRELTVTTERDGGEWFAVAIWDGLFDDSVRASRLRIPLVFADGSWTLGGPAEESWRCGRPDSPPNFTTELCP